jgi:ATP-dependent Clp protease, protease subunit
MNSNNPPGEDQSASDLFSRMSEPHLRLLKEERIVFLGQHIDDDFANLLVAQFLYLESKDQYKDIYFYINSPGGSVNAGMAIFDAMTQINPDVSTICCGFAAGMGTFLLAAGANGKRFSLANGKIALTPIMGGSNPAIDLEIQSQEVSKLQNTINCLLAKHTGQSQERIEVDTVCDYFLSLSDAIEYGLIDGVIDRPKNAGR